MQQPSTQTKFTPHDYVFLLITGVLFYLLNRFTPFPIWDDVMYQYKPAIGGEFDKNFRTHFIFKGCIYITNARLPVCKRTVYRTLHRAMFLRTLGDREFPDSQHVSLSLSVCRSPETDATQI